MKGTRVENRPAEISASIGSAAEGDDGIIGNRSMSDNGKITSCSPHSHRRCLVSRVCGPPERMLRFVLGPGDMIVPDLARRLPGRGMWLQADRSILADSRLLQFFFRAARRRVHLPQGLLNLVEEGLAKRLQDAISLARRAGEAVCGFQKCRERIVAGRVGVVICAVDASRDECSRLMSGHRTMPVVWVPETVLAVVFGRERAVYAVVAPGRLAQRLITEYERFSGVASGMPPGPSGVNKEQAEL